MSTPVKCYTYLNEEVYAKLLKFVASVQAAAFPDTLSDRDTLSARLDELACSLKSMSIDVRCAAEYANPSPKHVRVGPDHAFRQVRHFSVAERKSAP